ncbi:MAG: four helix bundle protein [Fimbriimonadaceae bacterium]|nr:four helix bundle protein [Fimbriimonadaceae bacterium]
MSLLVEVYDWVEEFPSAERYGLTSQLTRSAVSIPSNIAEGWGRRRGPGQAQFMRYARGSTYELLTQLEAGRRLGFGNAARAQSLREGYVKLSKQLNAYLSWLESKIVREDTASYGDE